MAIEEFDTAAELLARINAVDINAMDADRSALLTLALKADSGYRSDEAHRISPDQWRRILIICHEGESDAV